MSTQSTVPKLSEEQLNMLQACEGLAEYINGVRPELARVVSPKCRYWTQAASEEFVGIEAIEKQFEAWRPVFCRHAFAELGAEPVRSQLCVVLSLRESLHGRPGLGNVHSYFTLRLDDDALIEEISEMVFTPDPLECERLDLFPGLYGGTIAREIEREGTRLERSDDVRLELFLDMECSTSSLALTADVSTMAKQLKLPEPKVIQLIPGQRGEGTFYVAHHGTLHVLVGSKLVRSERRWHSAHSLEQDLSEVFVPLDSVPGPVLPIDYFASASSEFEAILRRIKGDYRRTFVEEGRVGDSIDDIPEEWLLHNLSMSLRDFLDTQHPTFRGGEDLPDLNDGEVEIARLSAHSFHNEVTSLRATRLDDHRFTLRIVDEDYLDQPPFVLPQTEFNEPLTAQQIVKLFQETDPPPTDLLEEWQMSSFFYPDLDAVAQEMQEARYAAMGPPPKATWHFDDDDEEDES